MAPTPTLPLLADLLPRQDVFVPPPTATITVVPEAPNNNNDSGGGGGPDTGAIVGIVIGVVVAIILIWWIVRSLSTGRTAAPAPDSDRQGWYDDRPGAMHGRASSRGRHHHHHRSRSGHRHHHGHRHSHSRHRSSTPRPVVVVDDKDLYSGGAPRRPSSAYVVPTGEVRRSRSHGRRSRSPGYYASY